MGPALGYAKSETDPNEYRSKKRRPQKEFPRQNRIAEIDEEEAGDHRSSSAGVDLHQSSQLPKEQGLHQGTNTDG
jgi:hypothetical protein